MRTFVAGILSFLLTSAAVATGQSCRGDCNQDCGVTIDDLIRLVVIANGNDVIESCPGGDADGNGEIAVDDIVAAVTDALNGCACVPETVCGDGKAEGDEECDDGGECAGGPTAGTPCTADSQCPGDGVCDHGFAYGRSCTDNDDCPGGTCVHCRPLGGDGCAANCTRERDIAMDIEPGVVNSMATVEPGTSGLMVLGDIIPRSPLPLSGSVVVTMGQERNGRTPLIVKASSVRFPTILLNQFSCGCVRGVPLQTCGATLFERDGSPSPSCTVGFPGAVACPPAKACASPHGSGNSASAVLACDTLEPIDVSVTHDSGGSTGVPGVATTMFTGVGASGSVFGYQSLALGTRVGSCEAFCTEADPMTARGVPLSLAMATGEACCTVLNANGTDGLTIGPVCVRGAPLSCNQLPNLQGLGLVGAISALRQPTIQDICITAQLFAQ